MSTPPSRVGAHLATAAACLSHHGGPGCGRRLSYDCLGKALILDKGIEPRGKARNLPVLVQFTGPLVHLLPQDGSGDVRPSRPEVVAQTPEERFIPVKIRSDEREDLLAYYGISGLPTTLVLAPNGTAPVVARQDGFADAEPVPGDLGPSAAAGAAAK